MNSELHQLLAKFHEAQDYDGIIQYALPFTIKYADDIELIYCLAMAYIAKGDRKNGISKLQEIIAKQQLFKKDYKLRLFINRVILQTVELSELTLHLGDKLGMNTLNLVREVRKFAANSREKELLEDADSILTRWVHMNESNEPVVVLIPDSPFTLQIEPTNACNLRCTMCPRTKQTRKAGFIDPALFEEILSGWKNKVIVKQFKHLVFGDTLSILKKGSIKLFFMGEPLLHRQLGTLIEMGNQAGCNVGIQTNGTALIDQEVREMLLTTVPSVISVSLDGINESSYHTVRPGADWQDICEGLEALHKERKARNLEKNMLILIASIVPELDQVALERAKLFLNQVSPCVDQIGFVPLSRERDPDFYDFEGDLASYPVQPAPVKSRLEPLCVEPFTKLNVLWDGTITPCCYDIDGEMPLGHVRDGIDNVWNSQKTKELQQALINQNYLIHPLCSVCLGNSGI